MFGLGLDGRDQTQDVCTFESSSQFQVGQGGFAFRQRARLVNGDDLGVLEQLQRFALAEEHAQLGTAAGAHHDRGRCGQPHGARAGDDQHRDGVDQRESERGRRAEPHPCPEGENRCHKHRRHEIHRHLVDQRLDWQLRPLRFFHHADDLRQNGVAADSRRTDGECAFLVHRSGHDLAAVLLGDGDRFSRDHRFIDIAFAFDEFAIHRNAIAGTNLDDISRQDGVDRQFDRLIVPTHPCHFGLKPDKTLDRLGGASLGASLQQPAEQDESDDNSGGLKVDVDGSVGQEPRREGRHERIAIGCHGADRDQGVHVGGKPPEGRKPLVVKADARHEQNDGCQHELEIPIRLHADR